MYSGIRPPDAIFQTQFSRHVRVYTDETADLLKHVDKIFPKVTLYMV